MDAVCLASFLTIRKNRKYNRKMRKNPNFIEILDASALGARGGFCKRFWSGLWMSTFYAGHHTRIIHFHPYYSGAFAGIQIHVLKP